jgi:dTDP-4-dehydrorhamnose 3,5-epimerase-like enzyme
MPRVQFFKTVLTDVHSNAIRTISDVTFPDDFDFPFPLRRVGRSARVGSVAGNHYHPAESGLEELFIVQGAKGGALLLARFCSKDGSDVLERELYNGDMIYVPTDVVHAFRVLKEGTMMWSLCSAPMRQEDMITVHLF